MFADLICDSPWAQGSHRGWTTLASFAVQALAVAALLLLPFLYTTGLPPLKLTAAIVLPSPLPAMPPPAADSHPAPATASNPSAEHRLVAPPSIPQHLGARDEPVPPPLADFSQLGMQNGNSERWASNVGINPIGDGNAIALPPPPKPVPHPLRLSRMMEGNVIHRVAPEYPPLAKLARLQGAVVLRAIISKQGTIENLQVVSGPPLLVHAAIDAVRQWHYRPYYLNDEPVEVDTQITVNFVLSGG
jgi:protein TonB